MDKNSMRSESPMVDDVSHWIEWVMNKVRIWRNSSKDQVIRDDRATAIVMTKLEEAEMWSRRMVREQIPADPSGTGPGVGDFTVPVTVTVRPIGSPRRVQVGDAVRVAIDNGVMKTGLVCWASDNTAQDIRAMWLDDAGKAHTGMFVPDDEGWRIGATWRFFDA
jgi:hypothetical protein